MRPLPSRDRTIRGQVPGRPDNLPYAPSSAPMACFIANEADIDRVREGGPSRFRQQSDRRKYADGSQQPAGPSRWASHLRTQGSASSLSDLGHDLLPDISRPETPLMTGFSGAESALSSTSSQRSSIAISSFEYENSRVGPAPPSHWESVGDGEFEDEVGPQLIMPCLTVPRRRPFSEVGKSLGKLKIMVAGRTGIGKTSLIRSLAQRSEHIVHIDPIMPAGTAHAAETYASSRPHRWWQTESDLHTPTEGRRYSVGEMLDRNVCFVESPSPSEGMKTLWRDEHYVESCVNPLLTKSMDDSDLLAILNAGGESIVDALLYLVSSKGLENDDIEYIKNAQKMTNVIPILARSDELSSKGVELAKELILQQSIDEDLDCFSFADPESLEDALHVFAVSTETQVDYDTMDTMDASVLMNSDYLPPLVSTDLGRLVDQIFSVDGSARLRHSAAIKCVKWRRERSHGVMDRTMQGWSLVHRPMPDMAIATRRHSTLDRSWARVDLYNWAHNLRQSLHTERIHHLMATRSDSHPPATESRLVPLYSDESRNANLQAPKATPRHQDPLGILELGSLLKSKGMLVLEVLSTLGLLTYVITRLNTPAWDGKPCHGAFGGLRRTSFDVSLGSLLS